MAVMQFICSFFFLSFFFLNAQLLMQMWHSHRCFFADGLLTRAYSHIEIKREREKKKKKKQRLAFHAKHSPRTVFLG